MSLLGTDIVFFVHGSEGDAYRAAGANVESHAIVGSMARIRFEYVQVMTHEKCYRITDREDILAVIGNGVMIALDSGCGLFGWSRNPEPMYYAPHDPFSLVTPVAGCFVCTKSRKRNKRPVNDRGEPLFPCPICGFMRTVIDPKKKRSRDFPCANCWDLDRRIKNFISRNRSAARAWLEAQIRELNKAEAKR